MLLQLSSHDLGQLLYRTLYRRYQEEVPNTLGFLKMLYQQCEASREKMDVKTGSISLANAVAIHLVTRQLQPKRIFEVGTFIGKSTLAMASAIKAPTQTILHTCDLSNYFHVPTHNQVPAGAMVPDGMDLRYFPQVQVVGHPKTGSTDALLEVGKEKFDLYFIDGRLSPDDVKLMEERATADTVIMLDDFEGVQKGIVNASLLSSSRRFKEHFLLCPADDGAFKDLGVVGKSNVAVLLPRHLIQFTFQ